MNRIIHQLKSKDNILVVSHVHPDGDAIGSLLAIGLGLDLLNKKIIMYNESPIPVVYRFLPEVNRLISKINDIETFDIAVILDCGDISRTGKIASRLVEKPIINIDHHITNTNFGTFKLIDYSACATAEIVYRLIHSLDIKINKAIATAIYTGILTDTGSFRFLNTNQASFQICEEMISLGVEPYIVASNVYGKYSLGRIKLINLALDSIEISQNGKLSIMTLTQTMLKQTNTQDEDIDGLINYAKQIENVKIAALIQEQPKSKDKPDINKNRQYHVSLRSDGSIDVALIAASFGGGGHHNASGFSIESSLPDIKNKIFIIAERL